MSPSEINPIDGAEIIFVPAGEFLMGEARVVGHDAEKECQLAGRIKQAIYAELGACLNE